MIKLDEYPYKVVFVSTGCTLYQVGQEVTLWEPSPAPTTISKNFGGSCTQVNFELLPDKPKPGPAAGA